MSWLKSKQDESDAILYTRRIIELKDEIRNLEKQIAYTENAAITVLHGYGHEPVEDFLKLRHQDIHKRQREE